MDLMYSLKLFLFASLLINGEMKQPQNERGKKLKSIMLKFSSSLFVILN